MNKQIISIILGLVLINLVSAVYPGETIVEPHNFGTDNIDWIIVDNTSAITIFPEISFNLTDILIYFPTNMAPNSFTLVFIEEKTNEVIKEVHVGGGTRTIYKNNTVYLTEDKYILKENNNTIYINNTISEPTELPPRNWIDKYYPIIIVLLIILFVGYIIISKRKYNKSISKKLETKDQKIN